MKRIKETVFTRNCLWTWLFWRVYFNVTAINIVTKDMNQKRFLDLPFSHLLCRSVTFWFHFDLHTLYFQFCPSICNEGAQSNFKILNWRNSEDLRFLMTSFFFGIHGESEQCVTPTIRTKPSILEYLSIYGWAGYCYIVLFCRTTSHLI